MTTLITAAKETRQAKASQYALKELSNNYLEGGGGLVNG